ncbi:hypothetical protein CEUSTIGMA_g12560.t1 [Chlamydomonas eustigma]|uniref:DNA (cytosine-5-)-methyltransferase n=1 Tax=Chlamydomonas eustigma TaxID=1157962 RepID=A0A250XPY2_9CHLO|nr:hypothetical protein CEUSTIGMA_g12560.t1 [Chlamydomonas eustigma]|eukprot:GAX85141.1 hypothetical protein CEUSTIGMA_g12560.t1 [Chlamydomonas eustigma]
MAAEFDFVDICCGIGAFHIALKRLGGKCVLACDRDADARKTYELNHGTTPWAEDVFKIKALPKHQVFCAGFPCTTFSLAGKRMGTLDTDAGQVIFAIMRLVKASKPQLVLLENVPGLLSIHQGETLSYIKKRLKNLGYKVDIQVHDAANFGAPMHRVRLIIAASLVSDFAGSPRRPKAMNQRVSDFLAKEDEEDGLDLAPSRYILLPESSRYVHDSKHFVGFLTSINYPSDDLTKLSSHSQAMKIYNTDGFGENFTSTHRYAFMDGHRVRYLSAKEMYRMMGFPKRFKIHESRSAALKQLSNSVNLFMLKPHSTRVGFHGCTLKGRYRDPIFDF